MAKPPAKIEPTMLGFDLGAGDDVTVIGHYERNGIPTGEVLTMEKLLDSGREFRIRGIDVCVAIGAGGKCLKRAKNAGRGCRFRCEVEKGAPMPGMEGAIDADYREVDDQLALPKPKDG